MVYTGPYRTLPDPLALLQVMLLKNTNNYHCSCCLRCTVLAPQVPVLARKAAAQKALTAPSTRHLRFFTNFNPLTLQLQHRVPQAM